MCSHARTHRYTHTRTQRISGMPQKRRMLTCMHACFCACVRARVHVRAARSHLFRFLVIFSAIQVLDATLETSPKPQPLLSSLSPSALLSEIAAGTMYIVLYIYTCTYIHAIYIVPCTLCVYVDTSMHRCIDDKVQKHIPHTRTRTEMASAHIGFSSVHRHFT